MRRTDVDAGAIKNNLSNFAARESGGLPIKTMPGTSSLADSFKSNKTEDEMKRKTEINISKIPSTSTPPAKVSKYDAGGMGIIPEDKSISAGSGGTD